MEEVFPSKRKGKSEKSAVAEFERIVLSKILFGSAKGWKSGGGHCRDGSWKERGEGMSPEERERVRSLWKQRCRKSTPPPAPPAETES